MRNMDKNDKVLSNYVAAFIDILGQRDQFRGCGLLPESKDDILIVATRTIEVVRWLHASFEDFCSALTNRHEGVNVPKEHQQELQKLKKIGLKFQRFSDGLVVYQSLFGDPRPEVINGLYGLIATCGSMCLIGLNRGTPIRAGIDVAWGLELNDNELYGCVLAKAYELESETAKYPRIVLGEHVRTYLNLSRKVPGCDVFSTYTRDTASACLELLGQDSDGAIIVDYLGSGFRKYIGSTLEAADYQRAYSYIEGQIEHWKVAQEKELQQRYGMLKQYFDRNRSKWGD
jgi:hypothetical protein